MWQAGKFIQKIFVAIASVPFMLFQKKLTIKISYAYSWTRENGMFMLCLCRLYANVHLDNYMLYVIPCDFIAQNVESKR